MDAGVAETGGRQGRAGHGGRRSSHRTPLYFLKHADVRAPPRLPAPPSPRRDRLVPVRRHRDGVGRRDPVADRPGDRRDHRRRALAVDPVRGARRARGRCMRLGLSVGRRLVAGRVSLAVEYDLRATPLHAPAVARARLLRPPADRPADVARDGRPAGGALLPRLRPHLHRPVVLHARARRGRDVRHRSRAGADRARAGAVRRARRVPLRPPLASRDAGGAAADRRADRGRRGERLRRARREGVRARAASARGLPPPDRPRVRPGDVHDAPAGALRAADRLPPLPRPRRDPARRRARGDRRLDRHRRLHRLLRLCADAHRADAHARLHARRRATRDRLRRAHLPGARPRAGDRRPGGRAAAAARAAGASSCATCR